MLAVTGVEQRPDHSNFLRELNMLKEQGGNSEMVISAVFCEPFTAADAIKALNQVGFEDSDIDLVGLLAGSLPNLTWLCREVGVPLEQALYYQTCFEDGGVLLIVRAQQLARKKTALTVLKQQGGIFPPTILDQFSKSFPE